MHDRVPPNQVVLSAADHDIGLALMQPCCVNHELAVPNKIFLYMMAGLAVCATRTEGHQSILSSLPKVGGLYEPGHPEELASKINELAENPQFLNECRQRSFELAQNKLNWEKESQKFIEIINQQLSRHVT